MNTEIKQYYDYYLETKSITATCKRFNKCNKTLARYFKKANYPFPLKHHRYKNLINENYFENINNQNKAYILGYIYADGCIIDYINKNSKAVKGLKFTMILSDREIIDFIWKELKCTNKKRITGFEKFISPTNGKEYIRNPQIRARISRTKVVDDLVKLGLCHRKTYAELSIPNISNDLIPHFLSP